MGVMPIAQALSQAQSMDFDLVEVAPQAEPPVCKIMDYGKFKYEQNIKAKEAKRRQHQITIKEMRMRPRISSHDYDTKKNHIAKFLNQGSKVKVMLWFRGREMQHTELGSKLLNKLSSELAEIANVEVHPKLDGRNMVMVLSPVKKVEKVEKSEEASVPASANSTKSQAAPAEIGPEDH